MHVVERPGPALRISGTVSERLTQGILSLGRAARHVSARGPTYRNHPEL